MRLSLSALRPTDSLLFAGLGSTLLPYTTSLLQDNSLLSSASLRQLMKICTIPTIPGSL